VNPAPNRARGILAATHYLQANLIERTGRRIVFALLAWAIALAIGAVCAARASELLRPSPLSHRMP